MDRVKKSLSEIIGRTPVLEASRYGKKLHGNIFAKLENMNPGGSSKDRVALYIIDDAERNGLLKKGSTIIESTSGNTGIGLASIAASRGYKTILVMPNTMSIERRKLLSAYGAEIVLTDGALGMKGSNEKAKELLETIPNSILASQFDNPSTPLAHEETTGPEIWEDMDGKVDILVAAVGTGGAFTGCANFLKRMNPDLKAIVVEPKRSPLLSEGKSGAHGIQGIGANFIPKVLDLKLIDEIVDIDDDDAIEQAREFAKTEGILCGISSGAALMAAKNIAKKRKNRKKNIVVILTDTGERYLSTELFE